MAAWPDPDHHPGARSPAPATPFLRIGSSHPGFRRACTSADRGGPFPQLGAEPGGSQPETGADESPERLGTRQADRAGDGADRNSAFEKSRDEIGPPILSNAGGVSTSLAEPAEEGPHGDIAANGDRLGTLDHEEDFRLFAERRVETSGGIRRNEGADLDRTRQG